MNKKKVTATERFLDEPEVKQRVLENMVRYGGSFVQSLSETMRRADNNNLIKIAFIFQNYIEEYSDEKWNS